MIIFRKKIIVLPVVSGVTSSRSNLSSTCRRVDIFTSFLKTRVLRFGGLLMCCIRKFVRKKIIINYMTLFLSRNFLKITGWTYIIILFVFMYRMTFFFVVFSLNAWRKRRHYTSVSSGITITVLISVFRVFLNIVVSTLLSHTIALIPLPTNTKIHPKTLWNLAFWSCC